MQYSRAKKLVGVVLVLEIVVPARPRLDGDEHGVILQVIGTTQWLLRL
jgi:hypothetical protein